MKYTETLKIINEYFDERPGCNMGPGRRGDLASLVCDEYDGPKEEHVKYVPQKKHCISGAL